MNTITPQELHRKISAGGRAHLLDVRTPCEHAEVHVPGVTLAPLESLDPADVARRLDLAPGEPLYVLCRSGARAKQAIGKLEQAGLANCVLVEGGTLSWVAAGLPVERGERKVISLERQVRIVAGALVFTGTVLGAFLHAGFLALPAFVGGGLVFAGIMDKCGMGLLLSRMPWNRIKNKEDSTTNSACSC